MLLCVIRTGDISHELCHRVAVIIRRPESVLADKPPWREDHKINDSLAWIIGLTCKHSKDAWVGMIVANGADRVELLEVILVRNVVALPGHNIERRVVLLIDEVLTTILANNLPLALRARIFLKVADGRLEMSQISESIRANWAKIRNGEVRLESLANEAAAESVTLRLKLRIQIDLELDAARNHADLLRLDDHAAELGRDV